LRESRERKKETGEKRSKPHEIRHCMKGNPPAKRQVLDFEQLLMPATISRHG
jgi:hypothetical protein